MLLPTRSSDFPTTLDGFDTAMDGTSDGFHARLAASLTTLEYGTFVGGSDQDSATGPFAVGDSLYLHGWTMSTDFATSSGAYDSSHNGSYDGFVLASGDTVPIELQSFPIE